MTLKLTLPFIALIGTCAPGCGMMKHGGKSLTPQSYLEWYSSSACPLRDTVKANEVIFILEQVPIEQEIARNVQMSRMSVEEAQTAYAQSKQLNELTYLFTVELPVAGKDIFTYNVKQGEKGRKEYVSFGMKKDLFLITASGDTVECSRALYEQGISNSPRSRFIIDFTAITREKVTQLLFRDRLWSNQAILFDLTRNQQAVLPRLKL